MAEDELSQIVVRVRAPGGFVAGAGMLVSERLIATCAHVVGDALGLHDVPVRAPEGIVECDLPFVAPSPRCRARVQRWWPPQRDGSGDVALLRLDEAVDVPVPAFRRQGELWGRPFRTAGFPPDREDGVWSAGELRRQQGSGWIQLGGDIEIGPGFSGAPIWDGRDDAVVAMAVAADRGPGPERSAYALPIDQILALAPELLVNPYRGLAAFRDSDQAFFFGRRDETIRAIAGLERDGLLVVVGDSGAGKSSFLAAGVVPAARTRGRRVVPVRLTATRTGADVMSALCRALAAVTASAGDGPTVPVGGRSRIDGWGPQDWERLLEGASEIRTSALTRARAQPGYAPRTRVYSALSAASVADIAKARLMLVLDQLEDLAAVSADAARSAVELVELLVAAGVWVAVSARWATLDELTLGRSAPVVQRAVLSMTPLDREGLREAVAEPAARLPGPSFDARLVARIVDDAGDEPGRLPLVAALLAELWDAQEGGRLTMSAYRRLGEVDGALAGVAERTWASVPEPMRPTARTLLTAMTRPGASGFVRGAVDLGALEPDRRRLVEFLAAARLVVIVTRAEGDVVELAHQSLIDRWPRLREWLDADGEFLRWRASCEEARQRWRASGEPEDLLRGSRLAVALSWKARRGEELTAEDEAYLEASDRRRRRERTRRLSAAAAVAVLGILVIVLAVALLADTGVGQCTATRPLGMTSASVDRATHPSGVERI